MYLLGRDESGLALCLKTFLVISESQVVQAISGKHLPQDITPEIIITVKR
jgi:hypothetical protein